MAEPFDIVKLIKSPFTSIYWVKIIALSFGIFVLFGIGYTGYKAVTKSTTEQSAQSIVNHNYQPEAHFGGCASVPVKMYR
jgi:hypothetical protein